MIKYDRIKQNHLVQLTPPQDEAFLKNKILTDDTFKLDDQSESNYFIKYSNNFVNKTKEWHSFFIKRTQNNSLVIYHSEPEKSPAPKSEINPHVVINPEATDKTSNTKTKLIPFEIEGPKPIELEFNEIFAYGFCGLTIVGFEIIGTLSAFTSSTEAGIITFISFNLMNTAALITKRQQMKSALQREVLP